MDRFVCLLALIGCLIGTVSCTPGETKFSSGAAAGAGIAALLGGNASPRPQPQATSDDDAGGAENEEASEDGLRYFGPL